MKKKMNSACFDGSVIYVASGRYYPGPRYTIGSSNNVKLYCVWTEEGKGNVYVGIIFLQKLEVKRKLASFYIRDNFTPIYLIDVFKTFLSDQQICSFWNLVLTFLFVFVVY